MTGIGTPIFTEADIYGRHLFGFWAGMPYGIVTDTYEDFKQFKNSLSKEAVIRHMESLEDWLSSEMSRDLFTGEQFHAGIYEDDGFIFPVDFLRYYKTRDIGIPYEYEAYLKSGILKDVRRES